MIIPEDIKEVLFRLGVKDGHTGFYTQKLVNYKPISYYSVRDINSNIICVIVKKYDNTWELTDKYKKQKFKDKIYS